MQSRKVFLTPFSGTVILGLTVLLLTAAMAFLPQTFAKIKPSFERHVLLEYFVTFLGMGLFFVFLRQYRINRTNSFLVFLMGLFSFVIFQILQLATTPGFYEVPWLPTSANLSLGFDLAARSVFSLHFLFTIFFWARLLNDSAFKRKFIFYLGSFFLLFGGCGYLFSNFSPIFLLNGELTLLTKGIEIGTASLFFAGAVLLIRRYVKENQPIYFWFLLALISAVFTSIYFVFWNTHVQGFFDLGHVLKVLSFSSLLFGFLHVQSRSLILNAGFELGLETDSNLSFHQLSEKIPDGVAFFDREKNLTFCNQLFAEMLNYSTSEIKGLHYSSFFDHKNQESEERFESEAISKYGEKRPVLINESYLVNSLGDRIGSQCIISDLTERKEVEKKLEQLIQEKAKDVEIFQQCIEHSTEGLLIINLDRRISYMNQAFEKMTGYQKSDLVGCNTSVFVTDNRSELLHQAIWDTVKEGQVWQGEFYTKKKDNSSFLAEVSVVPIHENKERIARYLWIERDVTRRKTLERSLQRYTEELTEKTNELQTSKTYYETLISGMSDILIVVDGDGECTFLNDYGRKRLNCEADDLSKQKLPIFFDDLKRLEKDYGTAIKIEIKDFEAVIKTKSDEAILCSWHSRPLFDRGGRRVGAMAVGRDITEYKKLQNELQEQAKNLGDQVEARTAELQTKVDQLAKLLEIGEEILLNIDVDVILNKICEAVQALGWKKVVVSLRDHEKRFSTPVAVAGLEPSQVEEVMSWREIPFEHTEKYFKESFRISNSYLVGHDAQITNKNTRFSIYSDLGEAKEGEWHSLDALLVPIRTKDSILGIISVDDPADRKRPGIEKIRDLEIFADKAALAIENARLFKAQKENERQTKFLAEISQLFHSSLKVDEVFEAIVQKGGKEIGEFSSLLLVDEEGEYLKPEASYHANPQLVDRFMKGVEEFPCKVGEGLIGSVASTGEPFRASNPFSSDLKNFKQTQFAYLEQYNPIISLMIVPLRVRSRIIGVLIYLLHETNRRYKNEDLKLAGELAERAALAVENARLFKEAGEKAKELEEASQLKSEFLASVSHELRTPLNAIISLSDILIRGMSGDLNVDQNKQLQIIQRSGKNLLNLINDILDLSKVESKKVDPIYSNIPVRAVIEETIEHIRPLCIQKGLKLELETTETVPETIYLDPDKLTKALSNLLSNAVKFTRKGKIEVHVSVEENSSLKIEVSDTGVGIPKDRIDEIFKEFHQIDSSDSRAYAGTGLGLAITRKVLDVIGGSISVKSSLGKGSTFTILIPIQTSDDLNHKKAIDLDEKVGKKERENIEIDFTDDRDHLDDERKSILVIDDEKEAIYIMRQYLHKKNYQVIFPDNGEDVIHVAKHFKPFAITLDIIMPDQDGWEILKILKNEPETRKIPVIITSILSEKERAFEMGADEYLVKPFDSQKLFAFLATVGARTKKSVISDLGRYLNAKRQGLSRNFLIQKDGSASDSGIKILLVDDDKDTQYVLKYILEDAGYSLFFANEGWEAVKQAESVKPDLILMDIMMPGMNGYEATRTLKTKDAFKNVPIVAMTAKAMKGDRKKTIMAGCDDYIAKPFVTEDILKMIEKWLQVSKSN
ncbi:response regulator [candidate division KSB1 bacterium]|nr:response regulator [candidate division KSB1 bacterium]